MVSFRRDQQNGGWQSGREMKCYYQGTYCLCVISLRNGAANRSPLLWIGASNPSTSPRTQRDFSSTTWKPPDWGVLDMRRASRRWGQVRRGCDGETAARVCEAWLKWFSVEQLIHQLGLKWPISRSIQLDSVTTFHHICKYFQTLLWCPPESERCQSRLRTLMKGTDKMMVCIKPVLFSKLFIHILPRCEKKTPFYHIKNLKKSATAVTRSKVWRRGFQDTFYDKNFHSTRLTEWNLLLNPRAYLPFCPYSCAVFSSILRVNTPLCPDKPPATAV